MSQTKYIVDHIFDVIKLELFLVPSIICAALAIVSHVATAGGS